MNPIHRRGFAVAAEYFNTADFKTIASLIADSNSKDTQRRSAGLSALGAALVMLAQILENTRRHGVTFTGAKLPSPDDVQYALAAGIHELNRAGQLVVNAVEGLRRAKPGFKATLTEDDAPKQAVPMPVQVISMPARKTVTDVERNLAGEITTAMQIESDF